MRVAITLTHDEIKEIIQKHIKERMDGVITKLTILSNSKQNYKATWEVCEVVAVNQEAIEDHNKLYGLDGKNSYPQLMVEAEIKR